jgi:hypothetical protein
MVKKGVYVEKRVTNQSGKNGASGRAYERLDAGSETFTDDLFRVFQKNVTKARRDNKRILGYADIDPKKR